MPSAWLGKVAYTITGRPWRPMATSHTYADTFAAWASQTTWACAGAMGAEVNRVIHRPAAVHSEPDR